MFFTRSIRREISPTEFIRLEYIFDRFDTRDTTQSTLLNEHCSREMNAFLHGRLEFD